jgi:hypothetical protein
MKKPPDKYKCIKLPITSILNKNEESQKIFNTVQDAVYRTNYITTKNKFVIEIGVIIDNIYGITPFLLKPSSCNYMLVKRIHNHPINKIMMTNKNNKIDMFNDHIYNKKNNSISDIKEDNNIKKLFTPLKI